MAGDLTALATKWNTLGAGSTLKKLATLNATTVPGPVIDIPIDTIANFLGNAGKVPAILAFVNNTPATPVAAALLACNYLAVLLSGSEGTMLKAASEPALLGILAGASADARTGITAGNITALNNVCAPAIPWWQANTFSGPITLHDLIAGGNLS